MRHDPAQPEPLARISLSATSSHVALVATRPAGNERNPAWTRLAVSPRGPRQTGTAIPVASGPHWGYSGNAKIAPARIAAGTNIRSTSDLAIHATPGHIGEVAGSHGIRDGARSSVGVVRVEARLVLPAQGPRNGRHVTMPCRHDSMDARAAAGSGSDAAAGITVSPFRTPCAPWRQRDSWAQGVLPGGAHALGRTPPRRHPARRPLRRGGLQGRSPDGTCQWTYCRREQAAPLARRAGVPGRALRVQRGVPPSPSPPEKDAHRPEGSCAGCASSSQSCAPPRPIGRYYHVAAAAAGAGGGRATSIFQGPFTVIPDRTRSAAGVAPAGHSGKKSSRVPEDDGL